MNIWRPLRLLPLVGLVWSAGGSPAGAQNAEFVISSGQLGGNYYQIGSRLQTVLTIEHRRNVLLVKSEGSLENLSRLADPKSLVNVALAQSDALRRYLEEHPGSEDEFMVLADIGKECVFLIARREGGITSVADLKIPDSKGKLSVGSPESGPAVTYEYLSRLEPAFRNTTAVHEDVMEALLQLKLGDEFSDLKGIMLVQRPRTLSPPVEILLDNLDTYRVVPIRSEDLASYSPGDTPVYTFEEVTAGLGRDHSISFETICTKGLMLAAKPKLDGGRRSFLSQVMLQSATYVIPGRR